MLHAQALNHAWHLHPASQPTQHVPSAGQQGQPPPLFLPLWREDAVAASAVLGMSVKAVRTRASRWGALVHLTQPNSSSTLMTACRLERADRGFGEGGLPFFCSRRAARTLDERDVRHGRHHKRQEERDDEGPHEGGRCSQSRCVCGQTERSRSSQLWSSISDDRRRNTTQDGISENLGKTIKTSATGTGQDRPQDTPDRCVCGEVSEGVR